MPIRAACVAVLIASPVVLGACASQAANNVRKTLYICEALRSPDANTGDGEVRFSFNRARAEASRKLWNRSGETAVAAALARALSDEDRSCLVHLLTEIHAREVSGW